MEFSPLPLFFFFFFFFFFLFGADVNAQEVNSSTTLFSCSPDNSTSSCRTFVLYRTQAEYADLERISDLFGVSRLMIKEANDLPLENGTLLSDQLILVPLVCGCTGNQSFANITYWIKEGDNFYLVSTEALERLTEYHVVQAFNPALDPGALKPGDEMIVPIYCKCPEKTQVDGGIKYLITYLWSDGDLVETISKEMGSSAEALMAANNHRNFSAAASQPILIPVPEKPHLPALLYNTSSSSAGEHHSAKSNKKAIAVGSVVGVVSGFVICSCLLYACCMISRKKLIARTAAASLEAADFPTPKKPPSKNQPPSPLTKGNKLLAGVSQFIDKPATFDIRDIMRATMNLNEAYWIEGSVYKATLGGEVYAVKQAKGDVAAEMHIFQIVNHANLIKLAGFAIQEDGHCFWVYEFVENGSLDKWLFSKMAAAASSSGSNSISGLSWRQRLNIALDVANGLQYLHEHTRPSIVHGAIKTGNILLDAHFKAKLSNFSAAKPATIRVRPSGDVFDFGVLLLELLSGERAMAGEENEEAVPWRKIRSVLETEEEKAERLRRWMDPNLRGCYPVDGAVSLAAMARACTVEDSTERPSISEIVFGLSVLAQSSDGDSFERAWTPSSEENVPVKDAVAAR